LDFVPYITDIVHAVIAGGIYLNHVDRTGTEYGLTCRALAAGFAVDRMLAVDRAGKYLRDGCFSRSSRAAKKIRMAYAVKPYLIF
jgi:hypothetical protein